MEIKPRLNASSGAVLVLLTAAGIFRVTDDATVAKAAAQILARGSTVSVTMRAFGLDQ